MLDKLVGSSVAAPIEAIGNVFDKLFTSDEEKLDKKILLERLAQRPSELQVELNKIEAQHRSLFVAGWRPAIGWTCAIGLFYEFLIRPMMVSAGINSPSLDTSSLHSLVIALLGLGGLRTFEKLTGKTK